MARAKIPPLSIDDCGVKETMYYVEWSDPSLSKDASLKYIVESEEDVELIRNIPLSTSCLTITKVPSVRYISNEKTPLKTNGYPKIRGIK